MASSSCDIGTSTGRGGWGRPSRGGRGGGSSYHEGGGRGRSGRGDNAAFQAGDRARPNRLCQYFARGACTYGSQCKFSHDEGLKALSQGSDLSAVAALSSSASILQQYSTLANQRELTRLPRYQAFIECMHGCLEDESYAEKVLLSLGSTAEEVVKRYPYAREHVHAVFKTWKKYGTAEGPFEEDGRKVLND